MRTKVVKQNQHFIGRKWELNRIDEIGKTEEANILVAYGRRRVGKTELLEQGFRDRKILKLEGVDGFSQDEQRSHILYQWSQYTGDVRDAKIKTENWVEVLELIANGVKKGVWTLYFEEVQWIAGYQDQFISALKFVWDNNMRHNEKLLVILCGSSPSFIINHVLHSRSLHNRSQFELPLKEFSLFETKEFLNKKSLREVMDAYLCVGGIPEYLKWIKKDSSVFLSLCKNSFVAGGFFTHEYQRIFTSSLSGNKHYQKIIQFLSHQSFATREEIRNHLKLRSGGGNLTILLQDLEICGFIEKYSPFHLKQNSRLVRFCIRDAYLRFYFKYVEPNETEINNGDFNQNPSSVLQKESYAKWLGLGFERMCRRNHRLFAHILGFESIHYRSGSFFSRSAEEKNPGFQIDLIYDRDDKVITLCEIKYHHAMVDSGIVEEVERKISYFPNPKNRTIQRVLITAEGASPSLLEKNYFDRVITLKDIFDPKFW